MLERGGGDQCLDTLTSNIKTIENQNQTNPDPILKEKLLLLMQDLRTLLLESFDKAQKQFKAKHYSTGNKAGKAMALRIKDLDKNVNRKAMGVPHPR